MRTTRKVKIESMKLKREFLVTVRERGSLGTTAVRLTTYDIGRLVNALNNWVHPEGK